MRLRGMQGWLFSAGLALSVAGGAACRGAVSEAQAPLEKPLTSEGERRVQARLPTAPASQLPRKTCTEQAAALEPLRQRARALAVTDGCSSVEGCRALPMGAKPCGGPWTYLPLCVERTDVAALEATLAELLSLEQDFNARCAGPSDCAFASPPTLALVDGRCVTR